MRNARGCGELNIFRSGIYCGTNTFAPVYIAITLLYTNCLRKYIKMDGFEFSSVRSVMRAKVHESDFELN